MDGTFGFQKRSSGVLLHLTSLPSGYGAGDLGEGAYGFADFLAAAGQRWWQMLPITPSGGGDSPYSSYSAFAGNPWLISLDMLMEEGLLTKGDVQRAQSMERGKGTDVDFKAVTASRSEMLRKAYAAFGEKKDRGLAMFCQENEGWLDDLALYSALHDANGGKAWNEWERDLRLREPGAMKEAMQQYQAEVRFHRWMQYEFDRQWRRFRAHCHERGVELIGDLPIFVAYDSSDVWAHQELFRLDRQGRPTVLTGAPPDAFTADGQLWGHPHYRWEAHRAEGYKWWGDRFTAMARRFDAVRIDHFLGFYRAWTVAADAKTAKEGKWTPGPREEFFEAMRQRIGKFPVIAEDLGIVTPGAVTLREEFGFPGMRVLQMAFDRDHEMHRPHEYVRKCVAYTGTHDNHTAAGWFHSLDEEKKRMALEYFGGTQATISREMVRVVMTSVADTAIIPMQDWLGLGDEARMNVPGVVGGNWGWRMEAREVTAALAAEMRQITEICGRSSDTRD
ncbi:MAG TPA: 4-alpha-glucanotransferase [Tepidisphaeraceae bacterium]|jgi:4-alpha-glucanotransferase|nr:4-alpha-glucanotransferase [Tepidisphaeraceae bacterium]